MMKELLGGKWLGHPLHPAIVHLPMGLFPAALLFDVLSRAGAGGAAIFVTSFCCIAAALLFGLLAAPTGLADWWGIKRGRPAYAMGLWHMGLNLAAVAVWAINLALRWGSFWQIRASPDKQQVVRTGPLVLSAVGTALLVVSAYLGSRMVFDQGIGVARFSKHKWREVAIAGGANVPAES